MKKTFALITAVCVLWGITSCTNDDDTSDDPKPQTATITGLFDNDASATVKGTFTNAEWNGVPDKIKSALNGGFNAAGTGGKNMLKNVFAKDITLIVEKNPAYINWKADGDKTIWINFGIINDEATLQNAVLLASSALNTNTASEG
jgi:hypothetical protein